MIGEFIHYYPAYTVESTLNMYAKTFFSMLGAMYMLKGQDNQQVAYRTAVAFAGGNTLGKYLDESKRQSKGIKGTLEEVRLVRSFKK